MQLLIKNIAVIKLIVILIFILIMGTLYEDIKVHSAWLVNAFKADGLLLDNSIDSIIEIDKFFYKNMSGNVPKRGGRLYGSGYGGILFSIGAYVGETIIKNVPESKWITDDSLEEGTLYVSVILPDGAEIFPVEKVIKRFKNGPEDAIYPYVHQLTQKFTNNKFNDAFWALKEDITTKKWWQFW